ncbi:hypothetical protein JCGZ_22705 [Jatropha curcas]|uniref:PROP1-like PPR domain-containing protein n=1 Tax=Jatropha curcas TaxID=180498 RepID=A0A067K135_JATCU|nr:hypothetical protein JCGZ_22705 [Jatropha curcas]
MASKNQILKLSQFFLSQKSTRTVPLLTKPSQIPPTPASPESPDVPTWLRESKNPELAGNNDNDFVIPSLANWVENHNLVNENNDLNHLIFEADVSDVDKAAEILNKHYPSTDSVVQALNECSFNATNTLISQLLERFSNDWIPAFGAFIWAKNQTGYVHPPELYNSMVDILGRRKKFNLMWELLKEMENLEGYVSLFTMSKVMRRLARAGKYEDAVDAFRGIEKYGVSKDLKALNIVMDTLVKEGSVEYAYSVFMEFKDCIPVDLSSFNILIHGYCKARKLEDAKETMNEMEKHGFHPNVVSYTCFIELYCRLKDFRNVKATLDEMQEKGCKPNVITYTIVMLALGKANQINEALEFYEIMKRNGCVPDSSCYSSLIFILSQSGRLKDAWNVFEDMKKQGVSRNLLTYNTMISCACTHLEEENAIKLLQRMEEDSCKPDIKTYAPLLKMCCRKKRMKVLKFLLSHMFKNNVSIELSTYTLLVRGLCKSGKLDYACSVYEETVLKGMVPKYDTYKMLVQELEQRNMIEAKEKIEKLMFQAEEPQL